MAFYFRRSLLSIGFSLVAAGALADARPLFAQDGPAVALPPVTKRQTPQERRKEKERKRQKAEEPESGTPDPRRPVRAVFGGAANRPDLKTSLDFTATVMEAYDQNRLADATSPETSPLANSDGFYSSLAGDLVFKRRGTRLEGAVTGGSSARYYRDLGKFLATDYHTGAGIAARLSSRTSLRIDGAFSRAPVDLIGVFADAIPPTLGQTLPSSTDFAVNTNQSDTWVSSASVGRRLTERSDVAINGSVRRTVFLGTPASLPPTVVLGSTNNGFVELTGGATYIKHVTPSAGLRLGYYFRNAQYQGATSTPKEHGLDIGLDFNRALSDSRRTMFSLKTGSAYIQAGLPSPGGVLGGQFRMLVDSALSHQLGETWLLVGSYKRGTEVVDNLAAPVFSDAVTFSASGLLSSRVDFLTSLSYSEGEPSLTASPQKYTTYAGNARLRVALGERWALSTEVLRYQYDFSRTPTLARGFNPRFGRSMVRAGLSLWMPLRRH